MTIGEKTLQCPFMFSQRGEDYFSPLVYLGRCFMCVCVHTYVYTHALNYNVTDGEICGGDKKDKLFNLILKPVLLWFIKMQIYIIKHEWNSFPNISFCFSEKFTFL